MLVINSSHLLKTSKLIPGGNNHHLITIHFPRINFGFAIWSTPLPPTNNSQKPFPLKKKLLFICVTISFFSPQGFQVTSTLVCAKFPWFSNELFGETIEVP